MGADSVYRTCTFFEPAITEESDHVRVGVGVLVHDGVALERAVHVRATHRLDLEPAVLTAGVFEEGRPRRDSGYGGRDRPTRAAQRLHHDEVLADTLRRHSLIEAALGAGILLERDNRRRGALRLDDRLGSTRAAGPQQQNGKRSEQCACAQVNGLKQLGSVNVVGPEHEHPQCEAFATLTGFVCR